MHLKMKTACWPWKLRGRHRIDHYRFSPNSMMCCCDGRSKWCSHCNGHHGRHGRQNLVSPDHHMSSGAEYMYQVANSVWVSQRISEAFGLQTNPYVCGMCKDNGYSQGQRLRWLTLEMANAPRLANMKIIAAWMARQAPRLAMIPSSIS